MRPNEGTHLREHRCPKDVVSAGGGGRPVLDQGAPPLASMALVLILVLILTLILILILGLSFKRHHPPLVGATSPE